MALRPREILRRVSTRLPRPPKEPRFDLDSAGASSCLRSNHLIAPTSPARPPPSMQRETTKEHRATRIGRAVTAWAAFPVFTVERVDFLPNTTAKAVVVIPLRSWVEPNGCGESVEVRSATPTARATTRPRGHPNQRPARPVKLGWRSKLDQCPNHPRDDCAFVPDPGGGAFQLR